ncbi:MAG: hypothetical protein ABL901_11420 [Hyphomicrobiaceae bacterium]
MALVRSPDPALFARQAQREILLWTTKDGREIPLDEMTDEHIANAVRVLTLWRARLRKRGDDSGVVRDLADAIARFKGIQRRRRKVVGKIGGFASKPPPRA